MTRISKQRLLRYGGIFMLSILVRWAFVLVAYMLRNNGSLASLPEFLLPYLSQAGDAPHYLQIAADGYQSTGDAANNVVFYPLYPLLIRCFSLLTGSPGLAAMVVSNVALGFAGVALWELFGELTGEPGGSRSWMALLLFLCYPFGMFLTGIYTESLFILLSSLCLLMIYRRRWWLAALAGFLASMCRAQGLILLLPAAYEWLTDMTNHRAGSSWRHLVSLLIIPLGMGVFLLINLAAAGDAFAFVQYEAAAPWYNTTQWIGKNLANHFNMAVDNDYLGMVIYWVQLALYFLGLIAIFAGIWLGERTSFLAFGGAYICVSYLHGWLISGPRYMLGCLPLFLLATRLKPPLRLALLLFSAMAGIAYMVMYLAGGAIM